jgi:fructose-bisphosphate aldolase class I
VIVKDELQSTIEQIVQPDKGILAADESLPTITKRFAQISVEPTEENRRAYRALLFTALLRLTRHSIKKRMMVLLCPKRL